MVNDELPCASFSWLLHYFGVGNDDGDDNDFDDDDDDDVKKTQSTHL